MQKISLRCLCLLMVLGLYGCIGSGSSNNSNKDTGDEVIVVANWDDSSWDESNWQ